MRSSLPALNFRWMARNRHFPTVKNYLTVQFALNGRFYIIFHVKESFLHEKTPYTPKSVRQSPDGQSGVRGGNTLMAYSAATQETL